MARKPPDLRAQLGSQLGSLFTRTLQQLEGVREVVAQQTRKGRTQLDLTLLRRKRKDALAELGEAVLRLARSGRVDEEDFPELSGPLASIEEVEDRIERTQAGEEGGFEERDDEAPSATSAPSPGRRRGGWPARARGAADEDLDEGDREEYDEDDASPRGEFDEDAQRAAAGRRLRGEDDYAWVEDDESRPPWDDDEDLEDDAPGVRVSARRSDDDDDLDVDDDDAGDAGPLRRRPR